MGWKQRTGLMLLILLAAAAVWLLERDFPAAEVDAKYANADSEFLKLSDQSRVHYRDQGRANGLPIVLVHGSNASLHTWEAWVAALEADYRIVTLDMPGHGLTGRTPSDDYSTQNYVAVVKALVEHLELPPFVLGGNSMGGGISWNYALAHPNDIRGLVLLNASGPRAWRGAAETISSGSSDAATSRSDAATSRSDAASSRSDAASSRSDAASAPLAFTLLRKPWFATIARYVDPYYLVVQGLRASHHDPALVTDALIDRYYDLSMRAGTREATLQRFGRTRSAEPVDFSRITVPTLVLWGIHDAVIPVAVGERFAKALPDVELIIYDDVGHIPMEEVPQRSAADVHQFIQARVVGPVAELVNE